MAEELRRIKKWGADGIIMREFEGTEELLSFGLPTVISTYKNKTIPSHAAEIYVDNIAIGRMAAEHLLNRGFQNFAFCGFDEFFWSQERYEGFKDRVSEAGFDVHQYQRPRLQADRLWDNEQEIMCHWLKTLPLPTGLMACIDERAQDILEACKSIERHIPEEIAIVSGDNDELVCELANPQISSVALNSVEAGYEAAHLIDQLISGEKPDSIIITVQPTHVVTRNSTDILAISDTTVADAVRYIREHVRQPIQVINVADAVATNRRVLERRFRRFVGRPIYDEIKRVRTEEISKMLIETDLSVSEIAKKLGFSGVDHVSRFYKQEKGINPLAFRKHAIGYHK